MRYRKIYTKTDIEKRIETGGLSINDDWPGLFICGDDCIFLHDILQKVTTELKNKENSNVGDIIRLNFLDIIVQEIDEHVLIKGK